MALSSTIRRKSDEHAPPNEPRQRATGALTSFSLIPWLAAAWASVERARAGAVAGGRGEMLGICETSRGAAISEMTAPRPLPGFIGRGFAWRSRRLLAAPPAVTD